MRYSFHGKVRATGQQVDGYVEAHSSAEAIDRLADQGIIGVHTVRPEAKKPRNTVILGSSDEYEDEKEPARALPAGPVPVQAASQQPIYIPVPTPVPVAGGATEQVLGQLVDKLATLLGQVEVLLSRPQQIVYQSGPVRGGAGGNGPKRAPRHHDDTQDKTLAAIFQTNMDLRRSLNKLSTVAANGSASGSANGSTNGSGNGATNGSPNGSTGGSTNGSNAPAVSSSGPSRIDSGPKPMTSSGRERVLKPQPAA